MGFSFFNIDDHTAKVLGPEIIWQSIFLSMKQNQSLHIKVSKRGVRKRGGRIGGGRVGGGREEEGMEEEGREEEGREEEG